MAAWRKSHQPFHWFIEFYDIVQERGGFDVIIGNPPYVEYSKERFPYNLQRGTFSSEPCGNLYAYIIERCLSLGILAGKTGVIVPTSSSSYRTNEAIAEASP